MVYLFVAKSVTNSSLKAKLDRSDAAKTTVAWLSPDETSGSSMVILICWLRAMKTYGETATSRNLFLQSISAYMRLPHIHKCILFPFAK
jgi:hypothetical protein